MSNVTDLNARIAELLTNFKADQVVDILTSSEPSLLAAAHQQQQQQQQQKARAVDPPTK